MSLLLAAEALLFTALVPGVVTVYIPYSLLTQAGNAFGWASPILMVPALALFLTGMAGYGYCAWEFAVRGLGTPAPLAPPKRLVVSGLYRRTRNPMFQCVLLVLLAEALLFPDPALFGYAGMVALILHLLVVLYEEPRLRAQFGAAYIDYCGQVPRWGVALRPFRPNIK